MLASLESLDMTLIYGSVAQLVEQRPLKAMVAGSNPARSTILGFKESLPSRRAFSYPFHAMVVGLDLV